MYRTELTPYPFSNTNIYKYGITDTVYLVTLQINTTTIDGEQVLFPINLGLIGVRFFRNYQSTKNEDVLSYFLKIANYLKMSFYDYGDFGVWKTDAKYTPYGCKSGWTSAMSQGLCLSVMLEAYFLTDV